MNSTYPEVTQPPRESLLPPVEDATVLGFQEETPLVGNVQTPMEASLSIKQNIISFSSLPQSVDSSQPGRKKTILEVIQQFQSEMILPEEF